MTFFFFFNDTATTEIYTLSLHDALPICLHRRLRRGVRHPHRAVRPHRAARPAGGGLRRSEEHTSELQSQSNLVCRLLLEKKKYPVGTLILIYTVPLSPQCFPVCPCPPVF